MNEPEWITKMFKQKSAQRGGVVRRAKRTVDFVDGDGRNNFQSLKDAVKKRGFHLIETANQYIVICETRDIKTITHR
jgi:hypothetical protein